MRLGLTQLSRTNPNPPSVRTKLCKHYSKTVLYFFMKYFSKIRAILKRHTTVFIYSNLNILIGQ